MSSQTLFTVIIFNSLVLFLPLAALILWKRPQLWLTLLTIFLGIIVGWLDARSDEVIVTVFFLLTFGFFVGFARPRSAWLHAVLLAIWVPIFGVAYGVATNARSLEALLTFIPTLIAAAVGVAGGVVIRQLAKVQDSDIA